MLKLYMQEWKNLLKMSMQEENYDIATSRAVAKSKCC